MPHEVVKEPALKVVLGKCQELISLDREIEMCQARLNEGESICDSQNEC